MFFLIKAAFWLGLVLLFLPEPGGAPQTRVATPPQATPAAAAAPIPTAQAVLAAPLALCANQPELCASGAKVVGEALLWFGDRGQARDTLTPADLSTPFGGPQAKPDSGPGAAPLRAPLPQRRPA